MKIFLLITLLLALAFGYNHSRAEPNFYRALSNINDQELYKDLEENEGELKAAKEIYLENVAMDKTYDQEIELTVPRGEIEYEDDQDGVIDSLSLAKRSLGSSLPSSLNLRDSGMVHKPIYQGPCGSCAFVSGVQVLEARIALVSENYRAYSVQNFMNCDNRVCVGSVNFRMWNMIRVDPFIAAEEDMPYVMKKCKTFKVPCPCAQNMGTYSNLMDEQHVIIGPTVKVNTEANAIAALQDGPLSTILSRGRGRPKPIAVGEECVPGGSEHGNSIIGYTPTHFIMQESYGKRWGPFNNGTWRTPRNLSCAQSLIKKAYYPIIFKDYDKTNSYFSDVLVDETTLKFVDNSSITPEDIRNIGVAKIKCGYMGINCKGVMVLSSGSVKLISDFRNSIGKGFTKVSKKTQMVVYLKHIKTGKYLEIALQKKSNKLILKLAKKIYWAAPFFSSYGRLISYNYPNKHLVKNKLVSVTKNLKDIDVLNTWTMKDCNLRNAGSGMSLAVVKKDGVSTIGGAVFDKDSKEQRFDIGLSGRWMLKSKSLGGTELRLQYKSKKILFTRQTKNTRIKYMRWNAGQVLGNMGKPLDESMNFAAGWFSLSDIAKYTVNPTDFLLSKQIDFDGKPYLGVSKRSKLIMTADNSQRWTIERNEI